MSFVTGVGLTSYGKHEGLSSLDLMSKAAELAIAPWRNSVSVSSRYSKWVSSWQLLVEDSAGERLA